jgi:hypothetical protein
MRQTETPAARTDGQLAVPREAAESHDRADERADRQQLVDLLRHLQERDEKGARDVVAALADVVLLADEGDERHERDQDAMTRSVCSSTVFAR